MMMTISQIIIETFLDLKGFDYQQYFNHKCMKCHTLIANIHGLILRKVETMKIVVFHDDDNGSNNNRNLSGLLAVF